MPDSTFSLSSFLFFSLCLQSTFINTQVPTSRLASPRYYSPLSYISRAQAFSEVTKLQYKDILLDATLTPTRSFLSSAATTERVKFQQYYTIDTTTVPIDVRGAISWMAGWDGRTGRPGGEVGLRLSCFIFVLYYLYRSSWRFSYGIYSFLLFAPSYVLIIYRYPEISTRCKMGSACC